MVYIYLEAKRRSIYQLLVLMVKIDVVKYREVEEGTLTHSQQLYLYRGGGTLLQLTHKKTQQYTKNILYIAACESVLQDGSEAWTMTKAQEKSFGWDIY